ncbi:DUF7696 family protein [Pararobbsia alpina]|uniref:Uncharacterized protein n=1 Tax=Pararobbsia alpina TaxID=621374 RepID=A0A6S7BPC1_9BURK|nr:hypothetical protein LMG28138_05977 [Pararobbsia alpina]
MLREDDFASSSEPVDCYSAPWSVMFPSGDMTVRFLLKPKLVPARDGLFLFPLPEIFVMTQLNRIDSLVADTIRTTLTQRRESANSQSPEWRAFCEAAYVAALTEQERSDYPTLVSEHRGPDFAKSLASDAEEIRLKVIAYLKRNSPNERSRRTGGLGPAQHH